MNCSAKYFLSFEISKRLMNCSAKYFSALNPRLPTEPLPSIKIMRSSSESQTKFGGHFWSLHGRLSKRSSLFSWAQKPVPLASSKITFLRTSIPLLHALLHSLQSPQSASTQGTLHASTLHICVSVVAPHSSPPNSGSTSMFRDRDMTPPPQSLEQPDQPDQSSIWQLMGHGCVLHSCSI